MWNRRTFLKTAAAVPMSAWAGGPAPIDVGGRKQLFIDDRFIARSSGIRLTLHPPRKAGAVMLPEAPWERDYIGSYLSVMEHEGALKMWYMCGSGKGDPHLCYATSSDGLRWERPELGQVDFQGSRENNIVLARFREGAVMLDPVAPAGERFKTLEAFPGSSPSALGTSRKGALMLMSSPDGIRWDRECEVLPFHPDSMNVLLWDARIGKYAAYLRGWNPLRVVVRAEIPRDGLFQTWPYTPAEKPYYLWSFLKGNWPAAIRTELPTVIAADDRAASDIYTPNVQVYPWAEDVYVAFPSLFRHTAPPGSERVPMAGVLDAQFASSRDGIRFDREHRGPYVRMGLPGEPDQRGVYVGVGMIRRGGEIWQYYGGNAGDHNSSHRSATAIMRLVQRLDGFVAAEAGTDEGEIVTPLMRFEGDRLELNIDSSAAGTAQVEMLDANGVPVPGFELRNCAPAIGNDVAYPVAWAGAPNLARFQGPPVALRFRLRNARLYAFQFRSGAAA
jgi:hypothetical protein